MSTTERFKLIPEVYLVLINDKKILLSRRFQTRYEDGNYSMVAGHVEDKESIRSALAREAKEEAGIAIEPSNLKHMLTMHRNAIDHSRIGFFFTAEAWQGEITNMEPDKCDDLSWFPLDQLPTNTIPYIRSAIESCMKGESYSEFGWGT